MEKLDWIEIIEQSAFTWKAIKRLFGFSFDQITLWQEGVVKPKKTSIQKVNLAITEALKQKAIPFHPAFGYATKEQFKKLTSMSMCEEYEVLKKDIDKQNKLLGKFID